MSDKEILAGIIGQFLDKKTDSISVSKGMTGKYGFDVKIYAEDLLDPTKYDDVINKVKTIYGKLEQEFPTAEKGGKE